VADLVFNPATHDATRADREIALSLKESRLRHSGRVVSRNALIHAAWDSNGVVDDNLIEVYIYLLRKKVDRNHKVKLIKTVPKFGYTIRDPAKAR
jgi:two-component system, OmpR family, response regulator